MRVLRSSPNRKNRIRSRNLHKTRLGAPAVTAVKHTVDPLQGEMQQLGSAARAAAAVLALAPTTQKNEALRAAAAALRSRVPEILAANARDLAAAVARGTAASLMDRLKLDEARVEGIAKGLEDVAALPDPIGAVMAEWERPNGLKIARVRVPLGVIGIIYESRPNVTADAGGLCLKSGNACILRGGSDSFESSSSHHRLHAGRPEGRRIARSVDPARPDHRPRRRRHHADDDRRHRRDHPARRQVADPARRGGKPHSGHQAPGRHLPRLCRCRRRSQEGARHRPERQDAPDLRLRRRRNPAGGPQPSPRPSFPDWSKP